MMPIVRLPRESLTLDPESLIAAWAHPRPLRPRPDAAAYKNAFSEVQPTADELNILRYHAAKPRRSVGMRRIAEDVLSSGNPTTANLAYGRFARRLCSALGFKPDRREDDSEIWMSAVAEG